jgi:trehalose synthase
MRNLDDYRGIVGDEVISGIYGKARRLYGKHFLQINSTFYGGGVAEILDALVPLMKIMWASRRIGGHSVVARICSR